MEDAEPTGDFAGTMLTNLKLSYRQQDLIVMEYLISEGHDAAARELAREAHISFPDDKWHPKERREIMNAVIAGKFLEALDVVHKMEVKPSPQLKFGLMQSHLDALIAESLDKNDDEKAMEAIAYARSELAPLVKDVPADSPLQIALQDSLAKLILPEAMSEDEKAELKKAQAAKHEMLARKLNKEIRIAFDASGEDSRLVKACILREAMLHLGVWES